MPNRRAICFGTGVCLALGLGIPGRASALPVDFELLIEASHAVEIFGLAIESGDRFTGTFTADSDDFQGTGSANAILTDFALTIGNTSFDYASLELGIVFTDSVLEAIQTGSEIVATAGPLPANVGFVAANRFAGFSQFPAFLNASYTITAVPEPITEFVAFSDPVGDHEGEIDLVRMEFRFDSGSGHYSATYFASPDAPFLGRFQLNTALFNPDAGSFLNTVSQEFDLATPTNAVRDEGRNPLLFSWAVGDRVAASGPDPLGVPSGVTAFASGVSEPVSLGVDRFSGAAGIVTLPEPARAVLSVSALAALAVLARRRRHVKARRGLDR